MVVKTWLVMTQKQEATKFCQELHKQVKVDTHTLLNNRIWDQDQNFPLLQVRMEQVKVDYAPTTFIASLSMAICLLWIYAKNIQNGKNDGLVER